MSRYGVVLFHTTSAAMRTEKLLLRAGLSLKLIPTPREFSSDCGIAVRFDWAQADLVKTLLSANHVDVSAVWPLP